MYIWGRANIFYSKQNTIRTWYNSNSRMKKISKLKLLDAQIYGAPPLKLPDLLQKSTEMPECKSPPQEWCSCCCDHSATDIKEIWWLETSPGSKQPAKAMRPPQRWSLSNKIRMNVGPSLHEWMLAASSYAPHATNLMLKLLKLLLSQAKVSSWTMRPSFGILPLFRQE